MYQTLNVAMDAPGDTQVDPEIFREFTSGLLGSNSMLGVAQAPFGSVAEEGSSESTGDLVVVSSQEQRSGGITSPMTLHDDPETQYQDHYAETSPLKLLQTPGAYASRKRDSQGQLLSSVAKTNDTPGTVLSASAFFGFDNTAETSGMSLTQAFNATQAKTSPAVAHPSEDVVFQRPSPNFAHARHTSPGAAISSPIKINGRRQPVSDPILRSSSEPRAEYESMKHSQERRSRNHVDEEVGSLERQDSWEVPTGIEKHIVRQKAKDKIEKEAARSLAAVTAPNNTRRRHRKRGLVSMRASTTSPLKNASTERASYHGSYDGASAETPYELSQPPPILDDEDSCDELSHEDLFNRRPALANQVKDDGLEQPVQVPYTSSHPPHAFAGHSSRSHSERDVSPLRMPESQSRASTSQPLPKSLSRLRSSKETEVVMDSQPDSSQQPGPLRYPSSPSTNQYSINQTTMLPRSGLMSSPMSSMIPMPPKTSSPQVGLVREEEPLEGPEVRVPSSPPLVAPDAELTYDEHTYDEQDLGGDGAIDNDVIMEDEEDDELPTPRNDYDDGVDMASQGGEDEDIAGMDKSDEVPETLEYSKGHKDEIHPIHAEDVSNKNVNVPVDPTQPRKHPPVQEIAMLEETQPSLFPAVHNDTHVHNAGGDDVNPNKGAVPSDQAIQLAGDNEERPVHEGNELPTLSQARGVDSTANDGKPEPAPVIAKGASLLDIANLPDTQRSVDLEEIDLPQLSVDDNADDHLDTILARDSLLRPQKKRRTTYSSNKFPCNQITYKDPSSDASTHLLHQEPALHTPGWSPPTTQDQVAQGAQAAAHALNSVRLGQPAMLKSTARFKPAQPQTPRKGALKSVNKALLSKSPGKTSPNAALQESVAEPTTPSRSTGTVDADLASHIATTVDDEDEQIKDVKTHETQREVSAATDTFVETPTGEPPLPNRVFAFWPGINYYYPATCLGRVDSHRLRIRFDDGNETVLENIQVRALDLRAGDQVKVDLPGMKKMAYVVVGFKDKVDLEDPALESPITTRHGYATVVLEGKQRDSIPAGATLRSKERVDIAVANIYLTSQLWARMKDRIFHVMPGSTPIKTHSQAGTPKTIDSAIHGSIVPRRSITGPSFRDSNARASSVASSARSHGSVFLNMAFAITSTNEKIVNKDGLGKIITSNGGLLVEEGFHELFDTDSYDAPASSVGSNHTPYSSIHGLQLKAKRKDLHFVALIAPSHSRSPKYIQALSLNIPCLHLRWIHDSIAAGHALPFAKYLLPAGVSTFLDPDGVVRSRDMPTYDPTADHVTFAQMIKDRGLLFRDQSVLIVTEENTQEPYIFVTHAMGATDVGQCNDLDEAKDSVESGAWDWVYVDTKPGDLAAAASFIFGKSKGKGSRKAATKKRKRDSELANSEPLARSGVVGEKAVRVVCGEFVIQSLILGALIEE